jgi:hypothetical protein
LLPNLMQSGLWQCGQVITIMDALYKQRDKIHSLKKIDQDYFEQSE